MNRQIGAVRSKLADILEGLESLAYEEPELLEAAQRVEEAHEILLAAMRINREG